MHTGIDEPLVANSAVDMSPSAYGACESNEANIRIGNDIGDHCMRSMEYRKETLWCSRPLKRLLECLHNITPTVWQRKFNILQRQEEFSNCASG